MLQNITIRRKLIFVFALLSFVSIAVGGVGLFSLNTTNAALRSVYENHLVRLGQLNEVSTLIQQNQMTLTRALTGDESSLKTAVDEVDQRIKTIDAVWNSYMTSGLLPDELALANQFATTRSRFISLGLKRAMAEMRNQDIASASEIVRGPVTRFFEPLRRDIKGLIQLQLDGGKREYEQAQTRFRLAVMGSVAALAVGLSIALLISALLIRNISRSLNDAVRFAQGIAEGDLRQTMSIRTNDEIGKVLHALRNMNQNLVKIVGDVRTGTDTITTASSEIASGNMDLSSRTEQQASSLEETASSMEELTSTVKQNADNARQANQLAVSASGVAVKGGEVVAQVVTTMGSINESAKKIVDIIGVIDGIAFQTNILALNAAVEAARAGEQGRGFAVVASEVRNLAQRSAAAAKEIKTLIGDSVEKVDAGSKLVNEAGATMDEIVESVKRVTDIMAEIMAASQEQSSGIEHVSQAIGQMDQVTQQNAALVEEAAAAAESLKVQAANLTQVVSVFKLGDMQAAPVMAPVKAQVAVPAARTPTAKPPKSAPDHLPVLGNRSVAATTTDKDWEEF